MERGVIETFEVLRPEVIPHFLMSYTAHRLHLPVLEEIERKGFSQSFLSDKKDWPRIGKPKSIRHLWQQVVAMLKGNLDTLRGFTHHDVLYLPGMQYFYFAILASLSAHFSGRKVLYHFHDLITYPSTRLRIISLFVTDFIHCSETGYQLVKEANPCILKRRNVVLPYRVEIRSSTVGDASLICDFEGRRNILFVGQVSLHKGIDILIKAFRQISSSYDDVILHIVGETNVREFSERFQRLVRDGGDRIRCWGWRDDVHRFLKVAYVYVHPSPPSVFNEAFGRGVVEAMSMGVPIICFRSGALPEFVIHEQTGLICEEESPECLAVKLRRFLDDPGFRDDCSRRAVERYKSLYSDQRVREIWLRFFKGRG